jgi:hypothetical protein
MDRESNNRLNDDDRAEKKRKKKTIEGNTFERGQNTEQQYESERKDNKRVTNDYQYTSNGNVVQ